MNLIELKAIIDKAVEYAGHTAEHVDVIICVGKKGEYEISSIYQGGVIPEVSIHVGKKLYDYSEN